MRDIGGEGTDIFVAEVAPAINIFFFKSETVSDELAVPYLACFLSTFLGGLTILSTYASFVDLTGRDFSIFDLFIFAVRAFSFASRSSKHLCKIKS